MAVEQRSVVGQAIVSVRRLNTTKIFDSAAFIEFLKSKPSAASI